MRPYLITAGAVTRRRQPGGGGPPPSSMVWSANTSGSDFTTVENRGIRSSGGSDVVTFGVWGPGISNDTMLWRPASGFNTTNITQTITSATFRIYMFEQFGASVVNVHENLRAWTNDVDWTTYDGSNNWATAGATGTGDRSASTIGSQSTPTTNGVWIEIVLDPAVVEAWRQAGGAPSNGIQLRGDGQFSSYHTNQGTDGLRPQLVLGFS